MNKIPYGLSNFEKIRTENYADVDKTRFIEQIENENKEYHFFIRPRKFGKSLFLSMLFHYYDLCAAHNFDKLFGDLYIGKNPTPKRNSYFVVRFSFSGINTMSVEKFESSFGSKIEASVLEFLVHYNEYIDPDEYKTSKLQLLESKGEIGVNAIEKYVFKIVNENKGKLFVIIDEYDHFANDLIALGTNLSRKQYKELIWANGVVRDFYETLKDNSQTIVDKIFITGITPMMLDDVTSGFNISNNLSTDVRYNDTLGFTEDEVERLIDECGIDRSKMTIDRKFMYNGYLFHPDAENKLYNSAMILYLLDKIQNISGKLDNIIDDNLKTDYGRIEQLLNKTENVKNLEYIIEYGKTYAKVVNRFSINKIHEPKNFLSLLYYMGLVTIEKDEETGSAMLAIPNYSVKTMYWEYMENIIAERNPEMIVDHNVIMTGLRAFTFRGEYNQFFEDFHKNFVSKISNRDLENFSEKNVKFLLLSIWFQTGYYIPISEIENSDGYIDIYLQRRDYLYPKITTDWILEIKYIKQSEAKNKRLFASKKKDAITQLQRYKSSNLFKDRTDVRYLAVVFTGKTKFWIEELVVSH